MMKSGDRRAKEAVYEQSFDELKVIARRLLSREYQSECSPTELVNEAYLRKLREGKFQANDRYHFFAIAARAMRSVLVELARERLATKRNNGIKPASIDKIVVAAESYDPAELIALHKHLESLRKLDPAAADVFELRFFLGYTLEETAEILSTEVFRVRENWDFARVWLRDRIAKHS